MNENTSYLSLYEIIREYLPSEPAVDEKSIYGNASDRNKIYLNNFSKSMRALQINSKLQKHLKDANSLQYKMHNDDDTKCIVAMLAISPISYPENLKFKNYSSEKICANMQKLLEQAFSKMDIDFLYDFQKALIDFIKKHVNDNIVQDQFISTIKELFHVNVIKKLDDIKNLFPDINEIFSESSGMLDVNDKLALLDFLEEEIIDLFKDVKEIIKIMKNKRTDELIKHKSELEKLESSIKLSEMYLTQPIHFSFPSDDKQFTDEEKDKINDIFDRYNQTYIEKTNEKKEDSRRRIFNKTKENIKEELSKVLSEDAVAQIYQTLKFSDTISSPVMNHRSIWQERTPEELLNESLDEYYNSERPTEQTIMEATCEQLDECFNEIISDMEIPENNKEQILQNFIASGSVKLKPDLEK